MVSLITYASRVLHLSTAALLVAFTVQPFLYAESAPLTNVNFPVLITAVGVLSLLTGLYNAHAVSPKKMGDKAGFYRFCVYGLKVLLWLTCTPLMDKVLVKNNMPLVRQIRLGAVVFLFLVASYTRYYREENQQQQPVPSSSASATKQA